MFEQRVSLIEAYLVRNTADKKETDRYLDFVTQTIGFYSESGLKFNVNELASRTFTSSKTIRRYFERVMGISPKAYIESVRMRTALPAFLSNRQHFDATEYGFYDRSHFYRSVAKFTGERIADCI